MIIASRNETRAYYRTASGKARTSKQSQVDPSESQPFNQQAKMSATCQLIPDKLGRSFHLAYVHKQTKPQSLHDNARTRRRVSANRTSRAPEDLFEENMHLKAYNTKLQSELAQLKAKYQVHCHKNEHVDRKLAVEFEKQMFWTRSLSKAYVISGIKHQYELLKKKYEGLQKQNHRLQVRLLETKKPELEVQIRVLQQQLSRTTEKLRRGKVQTINKIGKTSQMAVISNDYEQNLSEKDNKIHKKQLEIAALNEEIKQKNIKIQFLQKLVIERGNSENLLRNKNKKLEKLNQQLQSQRQESDAQADNMMNEHEAQLKQLSSQMQVQKHKIRAQFHEQIQKLNSIIDNLIEDKRELENNFNKVKMMNSSFYGGRVNERRSSISNINVLGVSPTPNREHSPVHRGRSIPRAGTQGEDIPEFELFKNTGSELEDDDDLHSQTKQIILKPRLMKTADIKHSSHAKRVRKIQPSQIAETAQLIRYRLMAHGITSHEIKKYFACDSKQIDLLSEGASKSPSQRVPWSAEHIDMREAKQVLMGHPFGLEPEEAHALARYLIEDSSEQHVYEDELNENKREVVKSIIRSVVGEYGLETEKEQAEIMDFKNKYLNNLYSALTTYCSSGRVSKKKLLQVLNSMSTDLSDSSVEVLLAKLVGKSKNLQELEYRFLLQV